MQAPGLHEPGLCSGELNNRHYRAPRRSGEALRMSKRDRVPTAWPEIMSDVMAAAYLDMSISQFLSLVKQRRLPAGRTVFESTMVRWRRAALDAAINVEFCLPINNATVSAFTTADGSEWMDAIQDAA